MPNGPACARSYLPQKPREDHAPTPCARFLTPSSTSGKVAVIGGFCPTTFLHGLPFTTISGDSDSTDCGLSSSEPCIRPRGRGRARIPNRRRPFWIPRASRPQKNRPTQVATTPTRMSKDVSATFWWTPRALRSPFTSVRPTYKIGSEHHVFWLG